MIVTSSSIHQQNSAITTSLPDHPLLYRTYWMLHCMIAELAILITSGYFIFIHHCDHSNPRSKFLHALLLIVVLTDFAISRIPVRILQVYPTILLGLVYLGFTYFYSVLGGRNLKGDRFIYEILDWDYPLRALGHGLLGIVGIVIGRIVIYGVYRAKSALYLKFIAS